MGGLGMRFEARTRENVDDGGIGGERMRTERVLEGKLKEAKGKVRVVAELEGDLGNLGGAKAGGGGESAEVVPPGFGSVVFEDGDCG
ncbi:unnamed protein product [Ilex paraguariensis]|uniref:Uncharacterized protein n=1 Tax=Ilex paraguariensis TaxID=185542 RepID=A0ABC8R6B7_9AQUA